MSRYQVAGVVALYMIAALIMVMVNKVVLNDAPNLPLLFMLFQSITTVLLLQMTGAVSEKVQIPSIEWTTFLKLAPLLSVDAAGFIFNALCLRDVEAAFYQIARGLVLPLTIVASCIATRQNPAPLVLVTSAIVTLGFFIGIAPSPDIPLRSTPTPLALFYGFISSCTIAAHTVLIKSSLPVVHGSVTQLAYWGNLSSAFVLAIMTILNGEALEFSTLIRSGTWNWTVFLWGNVVTGLFGFLISIAGILSVKVTSPVTHMFSSTARSVLQTLLGVHLFHDTLSINRIASLVVISFGTLFYTLIQTHQQDPTHPTEQTNDPEAQAFLVEEAETGKREDNR